MDRMRKSAVELMFEHAEYDYLHRFRGLPCDDPKKMAAFTAMNSLREQAAGLRRRREWLAELRLLKLHAENSAPKPEPLLSREAQLKLAAMDARREARIFQRLAEKQAQRSKSKAPQQRQGIQRSAFVDRVAGTRNAWDATTNPRGTIRGIIVG